MKYKIKSELTEKQIESDVATYFGWCTSRNFTPFRLLDIDEQITGADKKFNHIFPIYLQFKVSEGLTSLSQNRNIISKYSNSPLNLIRKFRDRNNLHDNPTLYFKLRDISKNSDEFQHNVLLKLANTGFSQAMYVAPLTLSKKIYEEKLFDKNERFLTNPFISKNYDLYNDRTVLNKIWHT